MKSLCLQLVLLFALLPGLACADVYKCVDEAGRVTYTNDKPRGQKGCSLLSRDLPSGGSAPTLSSPKRAASGGGSSPADFPRVDGAQQRDRDSNRRRILEQELATEQRLLDEARKNQREIEQAAPQERTTPKYQARQNALREELLQHETNINKLKAELGNTR
ncbi:DUF4124 domain-containing protein [Uliginosibacterium sediminicola]|uniref:DUF4124 domain-containing protein n=1 Tax=Uliginosibacterium sediminicola TaxID=2024550 RepID=A0ABU9YTF6_9RHOO